MYARRWVPALSYLVMPVLLVASQYASMKIVAPPKNLDADGNDPQAQTQVTTCLPSACLACLPCLPCLPACLPACHYLVRARAHAYPSRTPSDSHMCPTQAILKFLPLMIGWFSLNVPAGLTLYWFINNILSTAQQVGFKTDVRYR
jgi:membrane protein insertase Oxa1/YidC/SpoIIIJ